MMMMMVMSEMKNGIILMNEAAPNATCERSGEHTSSKKLCIHQAATAKRLSIDFFCAGLGANFSRTDIRMSDGISRDWLD
jgi:hypothetical protein